MAHLPFTGWLAAESWHHGIIDNGHRWQHFKNPGAEWECFVWQTIITCKQPCLTQVFALSNQVITKSSVSSLAVIKSPEGFKNSQWPHYSKILQSGSQVGPRPLHFSSSSGDSHVYPRLKPPGLVLMGKREFLPSILGSPWVTQTSSKHHDQSLWTDRPSLCCEIALLWGGAGFLCESEQDVYNYVHLHAHAPEGWWHELLFQGGFGIIRDSYAAEKSLT